MSSNKLAPESVQIARMLLPYESFDEIQLAFATGAFDGPWEVYCEHAVIEFFIDGTELYLTRGGNISATVCKGDCKYCTKVFTSVKSLLEHYGEQI